MIDGEGEVNPGLINWADDMLREWGKWATGSELPRGYVQFLGVRRSLSISISDEDALRIDAAVASLDPATRKLLKGIYLRGDRIRNRNGWRMALLAFEEAYRNGGLLLA